MSTHLGLNGYADAIRCLAESARDTAHDNGIAAPTWVDDVLCAVPGDGDEAASTMTLAAEVLAERALEILADDEAADDILEAVDEAVSQLGRAGRRLDEDDE